MAEREISTCSNEKTLSDEINNVSDQGKSETTSRAQGHDQSMPQSFSMMSGLGMAFSITNTWIAYLSLLGQNLLYGGPQSVILGLLVAAFVQWTLTLGLSELASAFPYSGGQYHYVYILAPKRFKRFSAFFVGWLSIIGWWIGVSSGVSIVAIWILGLVSFWDKTYVAGRWMTYLVYLAIVAVTFLPQYFASRLVPKIVALGLWLSLVGLVVTFTTTLAMRKHLNSSSYIMQSKMGTSGWPQGFAWVLGIINPMFAFGGTDAVTHIAEEIPNPRVKVPLVMNLCILIGACTAFPLVTVLMYSMADIEAVVASPFPSAEIIFQVTGSRAVTTFLMCWATVAIATAVCSGWIAAGRLVYAFARDGGVPFSSYFVQIDDKRAFPLRATIATVIFVSVYGLIFLASTTAFNSIITSAVLFLTITFAVPQAFVAARGRAKCLPTRPLRLGKFGYFVNIVSAAITIPIIVLVCFPPVNPITTENMNYASVVIVGIFAILAGFWYTTGRRGFEGPKLNVADLPALN